MCPIDCYGVPPFSAYLRTIGEQPQPDIDVFHTGPEICSPTIGADDSAAFAAVLRRQPIIWDNYPVNDLAMKGELHISPLRGRDPWLHRAALGVVVTPILQPEASKVLELFARYALQQAR